MKIKKRLCLQCGGTDVAPDLSFESYGEGSFFNAYKCEACGFRGILFPEFDDESLQK